MIQFFFFFFFLLPRQYEEICMTRHRLGIKYFEGFEFMIYHHLFFRSWWWNVAVAWEGFGEIDTTRAPNTLKVGTASSSWTWTSTTSFETSRCCCVHAVDSRVHSLLLRFSYQLFRIWTNERGRLTRITRKRQKENLSNVYLLLQISDKE